MLPFRTIATAFSARKFGWDIALALTVKGLVATVLVTLVVFKASGLL